MQKNLTHILKTYYGELSVITQRLVLTRDSTQFKNNLKRLNTIDGVR